MVWIGSDFDTEQNQSFDAKQVVTIFEAKGGLNVNEGVFKSAKANMYTLSDDFNSNEMRAQLGTNLDLNILDTPIQTRLNIDFLNGTFQQKDNNAQTLDFGNFMASLSPMYKFERSNLILNLGLKTVYFNDIERSKQKFYVYPNISASYTVVNSILIAYAGVEGFDTEYV